jgi:rare lipoprotein A
MTKYFITLILITLVLLSGCSTRGKGVYRGGYSQNSQPKIYSSDSNQHNSVVDKKTYSHPTMKPYVVRGIKYYPTVVSVGDTFSGNASWYGPKFHGRLTSSGEKYNMYEMTAAHKTLPMNTIVKVTNRKNGLSTVVRVNDRGPFVASRIIDLSKSAAKKLKMVGSGTAPVSIEILGFNSKNKKKIPTRKEMKKSVQQKSIGDFSLQIASFKRIEGAIETQEKYDGTDGYTTIIKDVENEDGRMFKVLLKGFKSEQEARDYKETSKFKNSFIVRGDFS